MYEITPLANSLFHCFLSYTDTIYFLCSPYVLSGTFSTILNRHACQASHLGATVFSFSPVNLMWAMDLSLWPWLSWRMSLLNLSFWKFFFKESCWVLPSLRWPCGFVFHLVNVVCKIYWLLLNDTCISFYLNHGQKSFYILSKAYHKLISILLRILLWSSSSWVFVRWYLFLLS